MGRRFVCIWLPHLTTDWFILRKPELKNIPFVLVTPSHGRMIISAASVVAEKKGIRTGTVLADARAIEPSLHYFDDKPSLQTQLLQRIAEWCIRFTPFAAPDPSGVVYLDATGCPHLWGNDEHYSKEIVKRFKEKGYVARVAMADTIGAAWAEARFGKSTVIEPGKQVEALRSLPPQCLRIDKDTTERLYKLGFTTIESLLALPPSALRRRFGKLITQRLDQMFGREEEFIQPVYAPEPFREWLPCPDPIVRLEGIEIALQKLLVQLCARLQQEGKGLRAAYFRGYRTDSKTVGITIATNRPSSNVQHLFHLFTMKLSGFEPADGIELFLLEATRVEEHIALQETFWNEQKGFDDGEVSNLLDRLEGKIGAGSIHRYLPSEHYWPERSFKKASSLTEKTTTSWQISKRRPLQIVTPPQSIEVTAPIPDYPPMLFRYKGRLHKIARADGPERIDQEWWIEEGEHRDYYAVEDEEGCRYWIFRSGHYDAEKKPQWFLHGFFA